MLLVLFIELPMNSRAVAILTNSGRTIRVTIILEDFQETPLEMLKEDIFQFCLFMAFCAPLFYRTSAVPTVL
jgi:hypothetical protein